MQRLVVLTTVTVAVASFELAAARSPPQQERPPLQVVVDSVVFDSVSTITAAIFTVRNRSARAVVIASCAEGMWADVERQDGAKWQHNGTTWCNGSKPNRRLAPRESAGGAVQVTGRGTFRVVVPYAIDGATIVFARSASFRIR